MKERSYGTRAVLLFPRGCISRDHAAFAPHFVLGFRFEWTYIYIKYMTP